MCIDLIKKEFQKNKIHISSYEDVDLLLFKINQNQPKRLFITFSNHSIKAYFTNKTTRQIINCNSSYNRFCEDMSSYDSQSIFNNVNLCSDLDILNIINKTNNILIG